MDFSKIARQLNEDESRETAAMSSEKAKNATLTTKEKNRMAKMDQKDGMAQQRSTVYKSDVSYASEEARLEREMDKNYDRMHSDWRKDLTEAMAPGVEGNHPYVDVMPFLDQKAKEARRQAMAAMKSSSDDGHHQGGEGDKSPKMEETAMDKAMALMRDKYKGAIIDPNKKKKDDRTDEERRKERERRARNRAKFARSEEDRLYGRKND